MKRILSILSLVFVAGVLTSNAQCCSESTTEGESSKTSEIKSQSKTGVKAYYFHATRRCVTCEAVESVTKQALKEYYGDKVEFISINREDEENNPLIEKYKVSGQTLLIIKDDKVVNLTADAFLNARTNPDKLKAKIKATVDKMI